MLELIIGSIIGAILSILIAEVYHRRASKETQSEIKKLKSLSEELKKSLEEIEQYSLYAAETAETIVKHVAFGTPDDPEYPYK